MKRPDNDQNNALVNQDTTQKEKITRRQFLTRVSIAGLSVAVGETFLKAIADGAKADQKAWEAYQKEFSGTPGYQVLDVAPGYKQVTLLESGKYLRKTQFGHDEEDIRDRTIGKVLADIGQQCDIDQVTALTESTGFGSATSGLVVKVRNCR